jgi:hypothetical protein
MDAGCRRSGRATRHREWWREQVAQVDRTNWQPCLHTASVMLAKSPERSTLMLSVIFALLVSPEPPVTLPFASLLPSVTVS